MFAKRLFQKATHHDHHSQWGSQQETLNPTDLDEQIVSHFGVPSTASVLAVDPIQQLLAIGTLDGRIKVFGGKSVEGLLISPKQLPYKNLEFLQNEGYLVGILNDNDIQVWNLERRCITCSRLWDSNITAFSVISGSLFMLIGDEHGMVYVLKYDDAEDGKLVDMPYHISPNCVESSQISFPIDQTVVGVLPQPCSLGNRLLIAYQYGLIILWDVPEAKVIVIKGDKDLHIKDNLPDSPSKLDVDSSFHALELMNDKEITALCWASSVGSMIAVGYIDGDILLWNIGQDALSKSKNTGISDFKDVVKLQLSSAGKRLPVIVLHWSSISQSSCEGQLFVYGGTEIGSEEVITVVSLQWSSGMEMLKNVRRVDLGLTDSFADMVLLSSLGKRGSSQFDGLFVLTSPGKLQFYAVETLSALVSHQERKTSLCGIESPVEVPTLNPQMTAAKFSLLPRDATFSMWLSEMAPVVSTLNSAELRKWPLSGGTHGETSSAEEELQKSIYIAGYRDGSVRIWDATNPTLSLLSVLEGRVPGIENTCSVSSVTKLDYCAFSMSLAVGAKCGAVCLYNLKSDAEGAKLHLIKHSEHEVCDVLPSEGPQCRAVVSLVNSPVRLLQYSASGAKLAVGYESGHVAILDTMSLTVLFITDSIANINNPVISIVLKRNSDTDGLIKGSKHSEASNAEQPMEELMFVLTQDGKVNIIDSRTGIPISSRPLHLKKKQTAISMYVLGGSNPVSASPSDQGEHSTKDTEIPHELTQGTSAKKGVIKGDEYLFIEGGSLINSHVLICSQNKLRLYDIKSVIQGEDKPCYKVKLKNTSCWTSLLHKDDKVCGLIVLYNSGGLEIRSYPDLKLVTESSLMSILRWNFRPNMEKLMSSMGNGLISLVNGSELAFISLSSGENERLLESLPLLHDKVVASAADAAIRYSEKQKKQVRVAVLLGGIVKGFRKEKSSNANDCNFAQLEERFSRPATSGLSENIENKDEEELDIDDIEIDDEPMLGASSSSQQGNLDEHGKGKQTETERERLFQGTPADTKPRVRTPHEIMAAYRGSEYAAAAAENARNKLLERQEKLERISQRTEDLRNEAEDFASMANELVKTMEGKKWWKI